MLLRLLHNELTKLFAKKRTYIGFGILIATQITIALVFKYTRAPVQMSRMLEGNGFPAAQYISALTIAAIMMFPMAYVLLPLYVTLTGGDLVAKEAEEGTLRMILSRPISRVQLILVKWLAGLVFATLLALVMTASGFLIARMWFPQGGLFVMVPGEIFSVFDPADGLIRYFAASLMLVAKAGSILSVAFMFSCFDVKPAAATILALSVFFVSRILQEIPYFRDFQPWFLTYHLNLWQWMFAESIPWWRIGESFCLLLGFNTTFLVIGASFFHLRDIKS